MKRREFMLAIPSSLGSVAATGITAEKDEKPLAVTVRIKGRIDGRQRRMISGQVSEFIKGSNLDGAVVFIEDDVVQFDVRTDE